MNGYKLITGCLLFFCACNGKSSVKDPGPRVKTAAFNNGETIMYEYDQSGQTSSISSNKKGKRVFSYADALVKETQFNAEGAEIFQVQYRLNRDGLVSNESLLKPENGREKIYLYNENGFLISETVKEGDSRETTVYHYTGNQLDSVVKRDAENKVAHRQLYTYYPDIKNTVFPHTESLAFRGKQSPFAVKKLNWIFYDSTGNEQSHQVLVYKYETDNTGKILKAMVNADGTDMAAISYTYY